MTPDWASIGVMLAVGGLLWRQIAALTERVDALAVHQVEQVQVELEAIGRVGNQVEQVQVELRGRGSR